MTFTPVSTAIDLAVFGGPLALPCFLPAPSGLAPLLGSKTHPSTTPRCRIVTRACFYFCPVGATGLIAEDWRGQWPVSEPPRPASLPLAPQPPRRRQHGKIRPNRVARYAHKTRGGYTRCCYNVATHRT